MKRILTLGFTCKIYFVFFACTVMLFHNASAQPNISFVKIAGGLAQPLEIKNAGDGSGRLFVAEQGGKIKIYKNNKIQQKPFLDLSALMGVDQFQGIWSIGFSPNYSTNRYFFIFYTDKFGTTALARYRATSSKPDSADVNSGVILLSYPNAGDGHYGNIAFGNDGYLYLSLGAGGNNKLSQNSLSDFGKMLRLNVNVSSAPYYSIPADNPYVNDPNTLDEIWALGLRNAWKYSFDKQTGDMWIGDVGQDSMEEIDFRTPQQGLTGSNFGWQCYEGTNIFKTNGCGNINGYVFPIFEYHHDIPAGGECLIGGYIYRGTTYPALQGYYICADFITSNAWKIKSNGAGGWDVFLQPNAAPKSITSFGEAENGELYAVSNKTGSLYSIQASAPIALTETNISEVISNEKQWSTVYPTVVNNNTVMLNLKEPYTSVSVFNMSGNEVMKKDISGMNGIMSLRLPNLSTGFYIVKLSGKQNLQKKIYVSQ